VSEGTILIKKAMWVNRGKQEEKMREKDSIIVNTHRRGARLGLVLEK